MITEYGGFHNKGPIYQQTCYGDTQKKHIIVQYMIQELYLEYGTIRCVIIQAPTIGCETDPCSTETIYLEAHGPY